MEEKYQRAIEMKYAGETYKKIAEELQVAEITVKQWFQADGLLYLQYLEYATKLGLEREQLGRNMLKENIENLVKIMINTVTLLINKANKLPDESDEKIKLYERATNLAERILDRAGLTVISKSEVKTDAATNKLTNEQYSELLRKNGIDPAAGLRLKQTTANPN